MTSEAHPSTADIAFRLATAYDAERVHALLVDLADFIGSPGEMAASLDDIRAGFDAPAAFTALLAERDGEPLGLCLWFPVFSTWRGRRGIYIQDLYVSKAARGTGLGRALLAEAGRIASRNGASFIRLAVDAKNGSAQRFYERIGFTWFDTDRFYDLDTPGFNALLADER